MKFLYWHLHRTKVAVAGGVLALVAIALVLSGNAMAHDYHQALASCAATHSCSSLANTLFHGDGPIIDLVTLTLVVPLVLGLFWGAPLFAKEFEGGTHNLAWTQSVSRWHWLRANIGWTLLAAALWSGVLAALVSWWRYPQNALGSRFDAFDVQGIVPVAYALFAVALAIAVGAVLRRVLPSLAVTLAGVVAIRAAVTFWLRPHFMAPLTKHLAASAASNGPPGSWILSTNFLNAKGTSFGTGLSISQIPKACQHIALGDDSQFGRCIDAQGFHQLVTYQPASRFWAFQGIETGIFVILAAALVGFTIWWVLSRDA